MWVEWYVPLVTIVTKLVAPLKILYGDLEVYFYVCIKIELGYITHIIYMEIYIYISILIMYIMYNVYILNLEIIIRISKICNLNLKIQVLNILFEFKIWYLRSEDCYLNLKIWHFNFDSCYMNLEIASSFLKIVIRIWYLRAENL
jgi:hypothetical protein